MKASLILCLPMILLCSGLRAQELLFAELSGSPVNTANWNLTGDARTGDTPGDADSDNNEIILCENENNTNGACFYKQPINLLVCKRWYAEFDYRMFDGNGADGLAFCFLVNPPTGFVAGGGIGIPAKPQGLMIVFDSYNNCNDQGSPCCEPKLQIRYGDGSSNYSECPSTPQPTLSKVKEIRSSRYNHAKVTYENGNIEVYINGDLKLKGYYPVSYNGYLGFTASTGASRDLHSIRNAKIYTLSPSSDAGPDMEVCNGETVQLGKPPRPGFTYSWSPGAGLSDSTIADPVVTVSNNTDQIIDLIYTVAADSAGVVCNPKDAVQIRIFPDAEAHAGGDKNICPGDTVQLAAGGGTVYLWEPPEKLDAPAVSNPYAFPDVTTTYKVIVHYGALKCSDTAEMTVMLKKPPVILLAGDATLCEGDSVQLSADCIALSSVSWQPPAGLDDNLVKQPWASPSVTTTYAASVTDTGGCSSTDSVTINIIQRPAVSGMVFDSTVCQGKSYLLDAGNPGFSYRWSTGYKARKIQLTDSGRFFVRIFNQCFEDTSWFHIVFMDCSGRLYLPNAFTPNGDGLNDEFTYAGQNVTSFHLMVFNRWGQLVFETTQPGGKWDGTFDGRECPMDVYFYMAQALFLDDAHTSVRGTVTLLR